MRPDRTPIHSQRYIEAAEAKKAKNRGREMTAAQKDEKFAGIVKAAAGNESNIMQRVGQGMIGPIQIRMRYDGITRNVLREDTLDRGPLMPYDILDDLGMAYRLNAGAGEVKAQLVEGKQAFPDIFRIASFPFIKKEDLYRLRVNIVDYAQDEARQAIQRTEDHYLTYLLEKAIVDRGAAGVTPYGGTATGIAAGPSGHTLEKTVIVGAGAPIEAQDFYSAGAMLDVDMLEGSQVLSHPVDMRDLYLWDTNVTGWKFKDDVVGGTKITEYGEFTFRRSVMIPQGEQILTCPPEWLGVFPVMYSLDVEENHRVQSFHKGWVMDEYVGFAVLNSRAAARIVKVDNYSDIGSTVGSAVTDLSKLGLYL